MLKFLDKFEEGYPKVNDFVLLLFCGYVFIWYLQIGNRVPALGEIRIELIWALVLTVIALFSSNKPNYFNNPLTGIIILFILCMAVQVPLSYAPEHSWNVFYDRVVKFSFMAFFIVSFVRSPKGLILFISAFMLACMKMGQEGMVGYLSGSMMWQSQGVMRLHGSTPLYFHPNSFSGMALGTIPFIICLFPIVPRWLKIILVIQMIFALNIILHTGSRTGYVAFFVVILVWFFKSNKKVLVGFLLALSFLIGYQFIDDQYIARFNTILTGEEIEGNSIGARVLILKDAIDIFFEYPLGVGVSAFPSVRMEKFGRFQDTHNLYLEVATNLGIQGLIVFCIFILKNFKLLNKNKSYLDREKSINFDYRLSNDSILLAINNSIYYYLVLRLSLGLFGMDLYEIYWWFISGASISIHNIVMHKRK